METPRVRMTYQSLPRLIIPTSRRRVEPEEITTTRVVSFLEFCAKHKRAPLTRLPSVPLIPPPGSDSESDTKEAKNKTRNKESETIEKGVESLRVDDPLNTIAFTENEWEVLEAKQKEYDEAKAEHTDAILDMNADPKDRATLQRCKHWRQVRERLTLEMSLIWERREIRRNFRRDANNPKGLTNW